MNLRDGEDSTLKDEKKIIRKWSGEREGRKDDLQEEVCPRY